MSLTLSDFRNPFFIGIAGTGMSALAQYLNGIGKNVSGSDRYFKNGEPNHTRRILEKENILCYEQDGSGIAARTDLVIVSTAIEESVPEMIKARKMGLPVMKRSELLSLIAESKKTIAVGGTSGKSTTAAMLFEILREGGLAPGIISGAGLVSLIKEGRIGNAKVGTGDWLVIEADESDGSITQYRPEIGVLLNIDKDHKEINELTEIFTTFKSNSNKFIVNRSHDLSASLSADINHDFSIEESRNAGYRGFEFEQAGLTMKFRIVSPSGEDQSFKMNTVGRHNMENAVAAVTAAHLAGVSMKDAARALSTYEGIYRRHQVLGKKRGIYVIDDYAHNPVKCAASIEACQPLASKVVAWFQPHGYAPTKFLRNDFVEEISSVMRPSDEIWMSEIFYAGGTTTKDISASDLVSDLKSKGINAFFIENRNELLPNVRHRLDANSVLLLMGARDPSLEEFASQIMQEL